MLFSLYIPPERVHSSLSNFEKKGEKMTISLRKSILIKIERVFNIYKHIDKRFTEEDLKHISSGFFFNAPMKRNYDASFTKFTKDELEEIHKIIKKEFSKK